MDVAADIISALSLTAWELILLWVLFPQTFKKIFRKDQP